MTLTIDKDKGNLYSLTVLNIGAEDKPREFAGTFSIDKNKNVITLDAEGDHLKFKVYNDSIKKLDKFGNEEQYGPAKDYILHKQN